jgi:hypothetical protein
MHVLAAPVLAADDFFDIANGLIGGAETVVKGAFLVGAMIVVGATYFVTRAFVPVLVAIILAGSVLWGVNNAANIGTTATTTINDAPDNQRVDSVGERVRGRRRGGMLDERLMAPLEDLG